MDLHKQRLTWRNFCKYVVVIIKNDYFEKDRLIEDTIEEFIIGEDNDNI